MYYEVPTPRVRPRCANAHNCLGLTLGRRCGFNMIYRIGSNKTPGFYFSKLIFYSRLPHKKTHKNLFLAWFLRGWGCNQEWGFNVANTVCSSTSPHLMDPQGSEGIPKYKFFTLNTYQLTFISDILWYEYMDRQKRKHGKTDGQSDKEVEIVFR